MKKVTVLGIGNILMMDDGIGVYVTEQLQKRINHGKVELVVGESDINFCIDVLEQAEFVVIIDAVRTNKVPGSMTMFPLETLKPHSEQGFSAHNLHLFDFLYWSDQKLKGTLIGIEPEKIALHFGLSPMLKEKFDDIVAEIESYILNLVKSS
ncbi:hydrogenase maturation protease [Bacillus tianshenii]|nr:hydrogenase maturation protease [Bacillus tianshenii]